MNIDTELPYWGWLDKVHCGDCLTLMGKMPAASIGLIVTSPPYNLRNSTGNGLKDGRGGKWPRAALIHGYHGHADNLPSDVRTFSGSVIASTAMMRAPTRRRSDFLQPQVARPRLGFSKTGVRSSPVFRSGKSSSGNAMVESISTPAISFPLTRLST